MTTVIGSSRASCDVRLVVRFCSSAAFDAESVIPALLENAGVGYADLRGAYSALFQKVYHKSPGWEHARVINADLDAYLETQERQSELLLLGVIITHFRTFFLLLQALKERYPRLSVIIVTGLSSFVVSILRNSIPNRIRIIVQLVVVALMVILVDQILKAYSYAISKSLSVYVGLIITNCIVMGRIEAYALGNKPIPSLLDGLANGAGYGLILVVVAFFRELLGSGTLFGYRIIPQSFYDAGYMDNGLVILPPMALILLGLIVWIQRSIQKDLQEK